MKQSIWLLCLLVFMAGCSAKQVPEEGFLGDGFTYSLLREDPSLDGAYAWRTPGMDMVAAHYDQFIINDVELWLPEQMADESGIALEELQELTVAMREALVITLGTDYPVVDDPGPRVARLEIAITEVQESKPVMNTITSILPVGIVLSFAKKAVTGDHANVGAIAVEMKVRDSMTGKRLAMFRDRKSGDKYSTDNYKKLGQAKTAIQEWAELVRKRMDEARVVPPPQ
ncbi:DUF3313 domain-containing protein [Desulfovibrio mangrovi]|uniref:DUF3313 domain-containing protein n=1 Tax=Desulfovibrio mangrovi TaxID=2976983 RepID=UPI002246600E|nr:DUF3313 domain-containing protein [Desulfovibrio mangrovi]UZP66344.1 DUF3313 domain-containing protein [Desulfovibrio mangrovi]